MNKFSNLGEVLNGKTIPAKTGNIPAYGGNGIISYVDDWNYPANTIIIGRVGAYCGAIHQAKSKCWVTDNALAFIVNKNNNPDFVYYLLKSVDLNRFHIGSSQPLITQSIINNIEYNFITDIEKQTKIARILNSIDSKIDINNKINAELESMAKTLYDYWFLQFEFPNEEGKPHKSSGGKMVWNEELNKEIPHGWFMTKIGDIIIQSEKSSIQVKEAKVNGKYPFFTSGESILSYDEYFEDGFNIFLNTGGNPDIKAYYGKCSYSTDTWCISAEEKTFYLYYYLLKFIPQFEQLFFAGSGLKHLQKNALKSKFVLLPDSKIINEFNDICSLNWRKITNRIIQNLELISLRDFLMPLLMNDQVTFKD